MTESEKKEKLEKYRRGISGIEIIVDRYRTAKLDAMARVVECGYIIDAFELRMEELEAARVALDAQAAEPDPPEPPKEQESKKKRPSRFP